MGGNYAKVRWPLVNSIKLKSLSAEKEIYPNDPMTIPVPPGLLKLVLYEIIEFDEESVDLEEVAFEEFNINSGEQKNVVFKLKE